MASWKKQYSQTAHLALCSFSVYVYAYDYIKAKWQMNENTLTCFIVAVSPHHIRLITSGWNICLSFDIRSNVCVCVRFQIECFCLLTFIEIMCFHFYAANEDDADVLNGYVLSYLKNFVV